MNAVLGNLVDMGSREPIDIFQEGYAALKDDLFMHKGCYVDNKGLDVIFDSGCTIDVSSFRKYLIGEIQTVSKMMQGLGSAAEMFVKGII